MVSDSSGLTHSRCGYDNLWLSVKVNSLRLIACDRQIKSREHKLIDSTPYKRECIFRKTLADIFVKHAGCFNSKRRIYIHRKIAKIVQQMSLLDLPDIIQYLLGPSYRKRRNDNISAFCKSIPDYIGQLS